MNSTPKEKPKHKGSETDTVSDAEVEGKFKPLLDHIISFTYIDNNKESSHKGKLVSYNMTKRYFEVEENGVITGYNMNNVTDIS